MDPGHLRIEPGGVRLLPALVLDKNQSPGFTPGPVFLASLKDLSPEDEVHCPVRALNGYIDRTAGLRGSEKFIFVSTREPHACAAKSTIAGWVREAISGTYKLLSKHYLKDFPNLKGHFGQAILTTAGSSGGAKTTTA